MREPSVCKRFYSDTFAPPSGFHTNARGPEVTAEEILAGGIRENDWSFPVLISTPSRDRQGDVVDPEGCDYGAFSASPVIFFEHQDLKFSVGKMRGPDGRLYFCVIPGKGILGRIWIRKPRPDEEGLPYAEACRTVWILVRDELLNGISAGFDPIGHVKELSGGGNHYKRWELFEVSLVNLAANRECRVIREPFSWDEAILKRFSPSVIKGLKIMTAKAQHHNTHDIKFRDGKWVILDNKTRKVLSTHDSRADALAAMRALQWGKHGGKGTAPQANKGMSEASGTEGGYGVPEEHQSVCKAIAERMDDHKDEASGHSLHFNPETGELHHSYPDSAPEEHVKSIAADLHDVQGVKSMTQEPESNPKGEGFHKIYPCKDMSGESVEDSYDDAVHKSRQMSVKGKAFFRSITKRRLESWSFWQAVKRIMPVLSKGEMADEKAIGVAWYIAGMRKGYLPSVMKDAADGDPDPDEAADDAVTDAALEGEETGADETQPRSLELIQAAIENLESALPGLEPQDRPFVEEQIERWRKWGEEKHPDEDFGGEDTAGEEGAKEGANNDSTEQDVTNEMLARYKSRRPARVKRISVVQHIKSLRGCPSSEEIVRKAAHHMLDTRTMPAEIDDEGCHLKGYTEAHHRAMGRLGRDLLRLHGAMTLNGGKAGSAESEESNGEEYPTETVTKGHDASSVVPIAVEQRVEGMVNRLHNIMGSRA